MNLDHGLFTDTEKQLAGVNADDGPYVTRLKVANWRGRSGSDGHTGQQSQRKPQPPKPAAPVLDQPQQPVTPWDALGVPIVWIGLIWFACWVLS
ncbi:MAG: hypothetical protein EKK47_16655 [Burkholderiales bacterium]|nr:MAG: hypothetical protein EKK47_16655 [Burkholderiales bacterium]